MAQNITVIVDHALTFIVGVAVAFFTIRYARKRRVLRFSKKSVPLISEGAAANMPEGLVFSVKSSLLVGDVSGQENTHTNIRNAYGTSVILKNVCSETVENTTIEIVMNDDATIIQYSISPSTSANYKKEVQIKRTALNKAVVKIPYINAKDKIGISTIAACPTEEFSFDVVGYGKGVKVEEHDSGFWLKLVFVWLGILILVEVSIKYIIPDVSRTITEFFGGVEVASSELVLPFPIKAIQALVILLPTFYFLYRAIREMVPDDYSPFKE